MLQAQIMDEPEYDSLPAAGRTALASQNKREFAERCGLVATLLWHWHCHRCRSRATCRLPAAGDNLELHVHQGTPAFRMQLPGKRSGHAGRCTTPNLWASVPKPCFRCAARQRGRRSCSA